MEVAAALAAQKGAELACSALQERLSDATSEVTTLRGKLDTAFARQAELRCMVKVSGSASFFKMK